MATATRKPYAPIPYGMADFGAIRREGFLFVDKTRFVRELENERYAISAACASAYPTRPPNS